MFGYNSTPPIDLPKAWVATPYFPSLPLSLRRTRRSWRTRPSARRTASERPLERPGGGGIANNGVIMTPYLVQQITNSDGAVAV